MIFISYRSVDTAWARELHQVLQEEGYHDIFLSEHPDNGIPAGANWEQTLWKNIRKSRAIVALCSRNWLKSPWCIAETMIAREHGKPIILLANLEPPNAKRDAHEPEERKHEKVPEFLCDTQFIDINHLDEKEVRRRIFRGLEQIGIKNEHLLPIKPYPGLESFTEEDAAVFFGRDKEIIEVLDILNRKRRKNAKGFILILGASGSGKSSLVRAGVLPRLRRKNRTAELNSPYVILSPFSGAKSLEGLAMSLVLELKNIGKTMELDHLFSHLNFAPHSKYELEQAVKFLSNLGREILIAHQLPEGFVVVVIDQLEESFRTANAPDSINVDCPALTLLLETVSREDSHTIVLSTMRSDFLNEFQLFPGSASRYEKLTLDPMPKSRFAELIEEPAKCFGVKIASGLTQTLIEDTRYEDALPLLAFTLEKLYKNRRTETELTLQDYHEQFPAVSLELDDGTKITYSGVSAAIKHVAESVLFHASYSDLSAGDPKMLDLRRAFFNLAKVGEEGQITRRTALWSQMPISCKAVLESLVAQRILISNFEEGEPTLCIAHEAVFRVWNKLRLWLNQDRRALMIRTQIENAAIHWNNENQAESLRWPEERILDAMHEVRNSGVSMEGARNPDIVRAFMGPTDLDEIIDLASFAETEDGISGSGRFGSTWQLPLGHEARSSLGRRLALFGDSRPGVGLKSDGSPDISWCKVEGGNVSIYVRTDPTDPKSEIKESITRRIETFWIAQYPVTITQFESFISNCYLNDSWNLPSGSPTKFPPDYAPPKPREKFGNYPADRISWYDASAFCYWLKIRLDLDIQLPTEFEWQLAATGGDSKNTYPWGFNWDPSTEPWRANTAASELYRPTVVGVYPMGATNSGIFDMVGTVYEWCRNDYDDPDRTIYPDSVHEKRVLRGGSWVDDPKYTNCTDRGGNFPNSKYSGFGMRVCCHSHPDVTDKLTCQ